VGDGDADIVQIDGIISGRWAFARETARAKPECAAEPRSPGTKSERLTPKA